MEIINQILRLLQTGLGSLVSFLAAHVLLCLLPAFFIAGALTALIPKEAITRYLGKDARKWVSYTAAALGGFVMAVCSCTIMPLFAGIYKKGVRLGQRSLSCLWVRLLISSRSHLLVSRSVWISR